MAVKCIDISAWQGKISTENFKRIYESGIKHIILRSSYTSQKGFSMYKDSVFDTNIKRATNVGFKIGVYHYSQAISVKEAEREAKFVLKTINVYKKHITLPVFFDWEFGGRLNATRAKKLGKGGCTNICEMFCDTVKQRGYTVGVYANLSTFNNYLYKTTLGGKYKIWVAQYNSTCNYVGKKYMWQYTSAGKVVGLNGNIDMNMLYLSKNNTIIKAKYTGKFPKLPTRGYFKRGDNGTQVKLLQKFLNWYGKYDLSVDGTLGILTTVAIEKFQKEAGLDVDGYFGKRSLAKAKLVKR